ncbi:MAG: AraC family transcriptional regulator [Gemmatimonadota bacterium]
MKRCASAEFITVDRVSALHGVDLVKARFVTRSTPLHSHVEVEIGVVSSGRRLVRCRGRTYGAETGSIVIFNPGEIHSGAPVDERGSNYRAFLVPPATLSRVADWRAEPGTGATLPWFEAPVFLDDKLARELVAAHVALGARKPGVEIDSRLAEILARLARRYRRAAPALPAGHREHEAVLRVRAFLDRHYGSKVRLGTLADVAGLSVYHMIRVFRATTGLPPYAYLEQVRVNHAAALLREGQPVSRVAFRTGFADQSHLTRFFKRLIGVPPGRYKRSVLLARRTERTGVERPLSRPAQS